MLKEFLISTADGLHLENEEIGDSTEVLALAVDWGEVPLTDMRTGRGTDFYCWGKQSRPFKILF